MTQDKVLCDIGFIGLGVMGKNLVLNLADNGFNVAAFVLYLDQNEGYCLLLFYWVVRIN